jgi:hypothetical protein
MVYNKTHKKLVIVTFNFADMLYTRYNNYYTLEPGEKIQVCNMILILIYFRFVLNLLRNKLFTSIMPSFYNII